MSLFLSTRTRLVLLVSVALLPVLLAIGYNAWEDRQAAVRHAEEQAATVFDLVVLNEQQSLLETKDLLAGLAADPTLAKGGEQCRKRLSSLLMVSPRYLNLGVIGPDGTLLCSALPLPGRVSLADRDYFRAAMKSGNFSVGTYQMGRVTGKPGINLGFPVTGAGGHRVAVVYAALDLPYVSRVVEKAWSQMPAGTTFTKLDRNGAVLSSYPYALLSAHRNEAERKLVATVLSLKQGEAIATGADGVERLYVFSPLWGAVYEHDAFLLMGVPLGALRAASGKQLDRALAILAIVAAFALLAVGWTAERLIVRPVRVLMDASNRLASGDLSARAGLPDRGELGKLGSAFDNMARRLEEKRGELSVVQARLAQILAASPAVIYACALTSSEGGDGAYRIVFLSENVRDLFGYDPGRVAEAFERWRESVHPDDLPRALDVGPLLERGSVSREYRVRAAAGQYRWILDQSVLVRDAEGRPVEFVGSWTDITDRRLAEETLALLGRAVDQAAEAIVITNREGTIEYVNPAFAQITGYTVDEAVGKSPRILKSGKHEDAFYRSLWDTISRGEVWNGQFVNRRKDGSFYDEEATISPVRNAEGEIVNFVAGKRDVTRELTLRKQVQTAQRMEAVGTLAGGIAHDFNNVLTGIIGFTELVKLRMNRDDEAVSSLDEILRCAQRAAGLTRQLLTYSRRQIIAPVNLSLNDVVTELMKLVSKVLGENIEIRTVLAKGLPSVQADLGQMEQVIMNLVLNARDAMPQGGRLVIETRDVDLDEGYVRAYPYMRPGRFVRLTVSDSGAGMDEETRERAFDPFFTTKGPEKGSGLGMAVVYGIVKQHGGFIHLYSEVGVGTTVTILLPPVDAPPDGRPAASAGEIRGGSETVLLAEDNESVRTFVERTLAQLGYTVVAARDGEEAVAAFDRNRERVSLALLDVVMPRKGGREAFEAMRREKAGLKVIYMSGYTEDAIHESFVLLEGVPFLQKPFTPSALARKVREVLDGAA
jgi:PAS domain S-box-containing protein